jgi:predicted PurR-regulated permease PerM
MLVLALVLLAILFVAGATATVIISQVSSLVTKDVGENLANSISSYISQFNLPQSLTSSISNLTDKIGSFVVEIIYSLVSYLPNLLITFIITFFIAYFILIDWENLIKLIKEILPFKDKQGIIKRFSETAHNIIFGTFLLAILQFVISIIGFKLSGISFYAFFALLVGILAFIPFLGPAVVWIPLFIIRIIQADYTSAIILLIIGVILSIVIDSLLATLVIGKTSKIHPVVVLLGVLGGVSIFGIFGFIIGPLLLSFFLHFILHAIEENKK